MRTRCSLSMNRVSVFKADLSRDDGDQTITKITPEDLGGTTGVTPPPVGLLLFAHYKPGEQWRPKVLSSGRGVPA